MGELDVDTAPRLAAALERAAAGAPGDLLVDLAELRFCDAAGLGVLVQAHHRLAAAHRRLVLVNTTRRFQRLVSLAELDYLLASPPLA